MIWCLLLLACKPQPTLATHGGLELVYEVQLDGVPTARHDEAVQQVVDTVRARAAATGARDAQVHHSGRRVVVQIVGDVDATAMDAVIGPTAELRFLPHADAPTVRQVIASLGEGAPASLRTDGVLWAPIAPGVEPRAALEPLRAHLAAVSDRVPSGLRVAYEHVDDPGHWRTMVLLDDDRLRGDQISEASVAMDPSGVPYLAVTFDAGGRQALAALTAAHTDEVLAMVLDDEVLYAPVVREPITGGSLRLDLGGTATQAQQTAELQDLAIVLRSGALSSPLELVSVRQIGPAP